jgi:heptosyltransferase-1
MNILIVKLSSLGDVIQTMPVVHDIRTRFPDANIDWMVEEAFAPLVRRVSGVRHVFALAQRRWRKTRFSAPTRQERAQFKHTLQQQSYDAVIDFQGLIKSALEARGARLKPGGFTATYGNASDACGYEWPVRLLLQRLLPMPQRIHAVARYRLLAGLALGFVAQGEPV